MKRLQSLCFCIVAFLCLVLYTTPAADAATYGDLTYEISDGEVTITACSTTATGDLVVPAEIDGYPVTAIGERAFYRCTGLTSVAVGDGVTVINDYAFSSCSSLIGITIPDTLKSIGNSAFSNCSVLTDVDIPNGVTSIGKNAFYKCKKITAVTIPDSVTTLGDSAFELCSGLKTVTVGNGLTAVGEKAFENCKKMTAVTIGSGVTTVGASAFNYCTSLIRVDIHDIAPWCEISFADTYANPLYYAQKLFLNGQLVTELTVPNTVTRIGASAFYNCTSLTSVFIPDSVISIGSGAFSGCSGLETVTIPFVGESRKTASDTYQYPFGHIFGKANYTGGTGTIQYYHGSSVSSNTADRYVIPTSLRSVTVTGGELLYGAFYNCTGLTNVTIGDGVTAIGDYAFFKCTGLVEVTIGSNVTTIGSDAFNSCEGLTDILIPNGVTTIGNGAFYDCNGLTNVTIPASVTNLEETFSACMNLVGIWVDPDNECYSSDAYGVLFNKDKTELITVPKKLAGSYVLPDSITAIEGTAFFGCKELTSVKIPDSVTFIDMNAFFQCTGLTDITIGNGVTRIGGYAFAGCTALTSIHIPDSVQRIGYAAFVGCTGLVDVSLGSGLTSIESEAFYDCNIKNVYYNGTQAQWDSIQIGDYNTAIENATINFNGHTHSFTNYVSNNDATYLADGTKTAKCDQCDATNTIIDEGSRLVPDGGTILQHPVAVNVDSGETATFSVTVSGEVSSYQWQYRKFTKWFDTALAGYSTDTLTVPAVGSRHGYDYRCVITFADGTQMITDPAKLTVNTYITNVESPNDQTVVLGYKGQFTASATGEGLKYQWEYKRPDGEEWNNTAMEGANKPTVMIESTIARDGYQYRCKITNVSGEVVYTEPATMRVLSFRSHPAETVAAAGTKAQFTVTTSVTDGFTYQWQYRRSTDDSWSNTTMNGYNTATLTVDATKARDGYEYRCIITGAKGSKAVSNAAVLHVDD